jgi:hypothetical protein
VIGYVFLGIFGINLLYVMVLYSIRHEGWFFIYNPNLGSHSNAELAWQIIGSMVVILIAWAIISVSKKRLKKGG